MNNISAGTVIRYRKVSKQYVIQHGKFEKYIPVWLCISVRDQVLMIIDGLEPGESYTLEELCGERYWRGLRNATNCRKAGVFMAQMVRKGSMPLKFAGYRGATRLYELPNVITH